MINRDFHLHTVFSDGENTPEEIVLEALSRGMTAIGFSEHSYTPFDENGCLKRGGTDEYIEEISRLKEKYAGKITILCGIEQDIFSERADPRLDYSIGSVHFIEAGGGYIPVDLTADILHEAAERFFGGDALSLAERYFDTVSRVLSVTGADVIGHFDLISKFNEGDRLFDGKSERYRAAWKRAADALLAAGKPFEINTGAVARGYRSECYPSGEIAAYIVARGGRFILSSDSHRKETLCFGFDKYERAYGGYTVDTPV